MLFDTGDNMYIRKATQDDISRIAEILVFVKRVNYLPIFGDPDYSFNTLQVLKVAREYSDTDVLGSVWVYDDGIVKGLMHISGEEIETLYVDTFFENNGIGGQLIEFAKEKLGVRYLWALEKNTGALRFYERHGFVPDGERKFEEGTTEYLIKLVRG